MRRRPGSAPVSPELLALLEGCKANPEDDQARLVLADWLEEHGQDERAALIRAQVPPPGQVFSREQLEEREALAEELQKRHANAWLGPLRRLLQHAWFVRGLLQVHIPETLFGSEAEVKLAACDAWPWVEKMYARLTAANVAAATTSPLLSVVSDLRLTSDRGARWHPDLLFTTAGLDNLRILDLSDNLLGDAGATALANCSSLENLSSLNLDETWLGDTGIAALAASPVLQNLRRLSLRRNCLSVTGAKALARSPCLTRLVELDLGDMIALDDKALIALADSPNLVSLQSLNLDSNKIRSKGVAALAGSPHVANLRSLVLYRNRIGPRGVAALAGSPHLSRLEHLNLDSNQIGDRGAAALVASSHLTALRRLSLVDCGIGARGLRGLPSSSAWSNLECLRLDGNSLGATGVASVAKASLGSLRRLNLSENQIGDSGAEALAHSPHLTDLLELELVGNQIGDAGAKALGEAPWTQLRRLNLRVNAIGDAGGRALLALSRLGGLRDLFLAENPLDRKVKAELRNTFSKQVYLDL
jgi:uncharacterized protein (TIGR02996 family)